MKRFLSPDINLDLDLRLKAIVIVLVATFLGNRHAFADLRKGEGLPNLASYELAGDLPGTVKGKVILLDLWASWCRPCKASFPVMEELEKTYGPKGFVVIAVSVDQNPTHYARFVEKRKPAFTVVHDVKQKLAAQCEPPTMPTSYLIDRSGRVRFVHAGFTKKTREAYIEEIEQLLAE